MQQNTSRNITPRTNNPGKKCDKVQNTTNTTRSPTTRNITTRKINMGQITTRANTGGNKILQGTTLQKNHNTTKEQLTRNKSLQGPSFASKEKDHLLPAKKRTIFRQQRKVKEFNHLTRSKNYA